MARFDALFERAQKQIERVFGENVTYCRGEMQVDVTAIPGHYGVDSVQNELIVRQADEMTWIINLPALQAVGIDKPEHHDRIIDHLNRIWEVVADANDVVWLPGNIAGTEARIMTKLIRKFE